MASKREMSPLHKSLNEKMEFVASYQHFTRTSRISAHTAQRISFTLVFFRFLPWWYCPRMDFGKDEMSSVMGGSGRFVDFAFTFALASAAAFAFAFVLALAAALVIAIVIAIATAIVSRCKDKESGLLEYPAQSYSPRCYGTPTEDYSVTIVRLERS